MSSWLAAESHDFIFSKWTLKIVALGELKHSKVKSVEANSDENGVLARSGVRINLELSTAAAFSCFLLATATFDNLSNFKPSVWFPGRVPADGMEAKVGMGGSAIYCIFSVALSRDVPSAFQTMYKISFNPFLSLSSSLSMMSTEMRNPHW